MSGSRLDPSSLSCLLQIATQFVLRKSSQFGGAYVSPLDLWQQFLLRPIPTHCLQSLLRAENIMYSLIPVLSYESIAKFNDQIIQNKVRDNELHTVIMINCGAIVNLNYMLFERPIIEQYHLEKAERRENGDDRRDNDDDIDLDLDGDDEADAQQIADLIDEAMANIDPNFRIYVIDQHRPFNLQNVYEPQKVE